MSNASAELWLNELRNYRRVALDTNVLIYGLENVEPYGSLVRHLFRFMQRGFLIGSVSTVVEAEVFVKPLRERDRQLIDTIELFFGSATNLAVRSVDRTIARRSAHIRAQTRLSLADAIIVATALEDRCDALIGNDAAMRGRPLGLPYLDIGDYIIP